MTARHGRIALLASAIAFVTFVCSARAEQPAPEPGDQISGHVGAASPARRARPVQAVPSPQSKARAPYAKSDQAFRAGDERPAALPWALEPSGDPERFDPVKALIESEQVMPGAEGSSEVPSVGTSPSLDRMIGQMIVVGFRGTNPGDPGVVEVRRQIGQGAIGGVMLMAPNIVAPSQTARLNKSIFQAGPSGLPPIISVDQEGGFVQRLSRKNGYSGYPSAWSVANDASYGSSDRALPVYRKMARELRLSGFNTNFGPVVDLNLHPQNPIIGRYKRSFSDQPARVTDYASLFCAAHRQQGLLTSAKHFPGHGSSRADSHKGFTDISKWWNAVELEPYRDLADQVDMIMVGHLFHPKFADGPGVPASLSRAAIDYVKSPRAIGFKGVVVTDDMEMGAVRKNFGFEDSIVRAVSSGVDILLYSNTAAPSPALGPRIHGVIRKAVEDGRIDRARIVDAYDRITRMKQNLNSDDANEAASFPPEAAGDAVR